MNQNNQTIPQTPYYFTVDDRTTRHIYLYETDVLEPTQETRTLLGRFPYRVNAPDHSPNTYAHVYDRVQRLISESIRVKGGMHLLTAWVQSTQPHETMEYYHQTNIV